MIFEPTNQKLIQITISFLLLNLENRIVNTEIFPNSFIYIPLSYLHYFKRMYECLTQKVKNIKEAWSRFPSSFTFPIRKHVCTMLN